MTLVFAIMHLYDFFFIASVHSFFYTFFSLQNLVLIKGDTGGSNSSKILCSMFVCFVLYKFVSGLILWFMDNLWFDDLRAE